MLSVLFSLHELCLFSDFIPSLSSFQVMREAVPAFAITVIDSGFAEEVFKE